MRNPLRNLADWIRDSRLYSFLFRTEIEVRVIAINSKGKPVSKSAEGFDFKGLVLDGYKEPRNVQIIGGTPYVPIRVGWKEKVGRKVAKEGNPHKFIYKLNGKLVLSENREEYAIILTKPVGGEAN